MIHLPPLVSVPVSFFDCRTGISALAVQHLRADGRTAVVYHDAPSQSAVGGLLAAVAECLIDEMSAGQVLSLVETSMPEHPLETFLYAQVTMWHSSPPARINARSSRPLTPESVARRCGISLDELVRTEELVSAIHRPRECAFAGFRQLALDVRGRPVRAAA